MRPQLGSAGNGLTLVPFQIPQVDGDLWWRYVAKLQKWPLDVGDPEDVKAVQAELMKVFQPNQANNKLQPKPQQGSHKSMSLLLGSLLCAISQQPYVESATS